jgi:hypothetical protein
LHPRVHFWLLNPHESTEFALGARTNAERDGVVLPDLDAPAWPTLVAMPPSRSGLQSMKCSS